MARDFQLVLSIPKAAAWVSTRRSKKREMNSGLEFIGLYRQRQPGQPTQLPTQDSYP
jgi:hypothetical protein